MNVPVELIVLGLTCIGGLFSIAIHLLIRINGNVSKICTAHEVAQTRNAEKIASLERHSARNDAEIAWMRRHLGLPQQPHHHPQGANL